MNLPNFIKPDDPLTIAEAAKVADVDRSVIEAALDAKQLQGSQAFRRVTVIRAEALANWLANCEKGSV